ncbi:MAG: fibronectin type III domain-containing protein [Bacteroidia bacterium]|nr:fibronectin type III domain-containing protein [Bacteroidia bacterium]
MKKISLLFYSIAILFLPNKFIKAQSVVNYTFSPSSSTYTPIVGGNILPISGTLNDGYGAGIPIGFSFIYNSQSYTTVSVSTNGYLCLGNAITSAVNVANNLSTGTGAGAPRAIIAPLWDNLLFNNASDLRYTTIGSAPNRTFIMQWQNARWSSTAGAPGISFQAKLHEGDSKIEFVYQTEPGGLNAASASIGITNVATGPRNFFCLTSTSNNTFDTSTITETNTLNTKPNNGQSYSFTPKFQSPNAPSTLTYTNVTGTQITVNWNDSSNSETYFLVYMSTDDINYNLASNIVSQNSIGVGSAYQYNFSGLVPGNTYYFRVYACNEGSLPNNYAQGNTNTAAGLLSGTKTICPTLCDYTSIGNACNDIRSKGIDGSLILELMPSYLPSVETYPLAFGNLLTTSSNTVTIRPNAAVTNPIIFTSNAGSTFLLNQTNYLSIDGRLGGTGAAEFIQINNTNSVGAAINFINNSSNNTVTHCRLTGRSQSTSSGVVNFLTSTFSEGNNYNTIVNNSIKDSINNPIYGIYSGGSANSPNLYNSVYDNNIYNYYNNSNPSYGIQIATGSNSWFISNNSFYQTSSRNISTTYAGAINIFNGSNYTLIGNYIGGSAPNCGGSATLYTGTGFTNFIRLNLSSSNTNILLGNYIQNISLSWSGSSGVSSLINLINGAFNVSGNQLGSDQTNLKINVSNNTGTIDFAAINMGGGSSYDESQISYNTISGFTLGATGFGNVQFSGIRITSAVPSLSILENTIGSQTQENSIQNFSKAFTYGIVGPNASSQNIISGNTIANLHGNNTDSMANVCGIFMNSSGSFTVTKNTIFKLFSKSVVSMNGFQAPVIGINQMCSGPDQECSFNTIYNLYANNSANTNMNMVFGIKVGNSSTGTNNISNNFIHTLHSSALFGSTIVGIFNWNSSTICTNNMIRLGIDSNGNGIMANQSLIGIQDLGNSNSYYHNSIYIGGSYNGPNNLNSYAYFNSLLSSGTRNIINNIFYTARSNFGSSGKHCAIGFTSINLNGLTLDHNIYFAPNSGGFLARIGITDYISLQTMRSLTFMDIHSGVGNPNFVNPTGNVLNLSLKLQTNTPAEGSGMLIEEVENDFEGESRLANSATDIGADAGNYNKVDIFAPLINLLPLSNTTSIANRTFSVQITDAHIGVNTNSTLRPRVYYRRVAPSTSAWQSAQGTLVSGTKNDGTWSFTIDYSLTGFPVNVGHRYQYYIAAQDSANPANLFVYPFQGANHASVNSMITAPTNAFIYNIVNGLPTTLTVGAGQTYTTLTGNTGLFAAINNGVLSGNTVATIVSNTTEPGTIALTNMGLAGFNLLIKPDNNARVISGAVTTGSLAMVCIDGANNVSIDGGANKLLTLRNAIGTAPSGSTAPAIRIRSGNNDTIRNCIIEGNSSNSGIGTIHLNTTNISLPSDNIVIQNNIIRPPLNDSTNSPNTPIIINSAAGNIRNSKIIGNHIIDYNTYGIYIANAGKNISIGDSTDASKGNHFVQRRGRTAAFYSIIIGSGNNHIIGNNKIYNVHNVTHSIGNYGIYVFNGINNTLVTHNSIGGNSENRAGNPYRNSNFYTAIYINAGNLQNSRIENNQIGNILLNGTSGTFTGIYGVGGKLSIKDNIIGVDKLGGADWDSISVRQSFYGIRYISSSNVQISGNQIRNIFNNGSGFTVGMSIENGVFSVQNNEMSHFYTRNSTTNNVDYSCVGIRISAARTDNNIENNLIYNLNNFSSLNGATVTGIAIMNAIKTSQVHRNRIYQLHATHTGLAANSPTIRGIYIGSNGSTTYHNNQITIIHDLPNTQPRIRGIDLSASGGTNQFYYNSIYLGGQNANPNNSSAFYRNVSSSTAAVELVNNILYNERGGAGSHFAISSNISGNFLHDNNLLVNAITGSLIEWPLGTTRNINSWNTATGNPIYNLINTNLEMESDSFFENKNAGNLNSNSCRIADAGAYVNVPHDFNNQARSIPPDIGSTEFTLVSGKPFISKQAINDTIFCNGGNSHFTIKARGLGLSYQWQIKQGSTWLNLSDNATYSGTTKDSMHLLAPNSSMHTNEYRCVVKGICTPADTSLAARLIVISTNNWTGAANTQWNNPANWSCGIVPTHTTDAIIPNVSNLPIISDSTNNCYKLSIASGASVTLNNAAAKLAIYGEVELNGNLNNSLGTIAFSGNALQEIPGISYHKLEVNNASGLSLAGNVSIQNQINFVQGTISLNAYNLSLLGNSSHIYGANSSNKFIICNDTGMLIIQNIGSGGRTGLVSFPIGSNQNSFTPFSIQNTGTMDQFRARVIPKVYNQYAANGNPIGAFYTANAVDKTWIIQEQTAGGSLANLNFTWNVADELIGFNRSSSYVGTYNGSVWTGNTATSASGTNPYSQSISGVSNFHIFGVASGGILPVTLLSFDVIAKEESNELNWQTAQEKNAAYFDIERSANGLTFETIGKVKAAGNSDIKRRYLYQDYSIESNSVWYYRLKQVDNDASFSYSDVRKIAREKVGSDLVNVYPNPFNETLIISKDKIDNEEIQLVLSDVNGKLIWNKKVLVSKEYTLEDLGKLDAGVYILQLHTANYRKQVKLIKER